MSKCSMRVCNNVKCIPDTPAPTLIVWAQCECHVWPLADPAIYGFRPCGECGTLPIPGVPPTQSGRAERLEAWSE